MPGVIEDLRNFTVVPSPRAEIVASVQMPDAASILQSASHRLGGALLDGISSVLEGIRSFARYSVSAELPNQAMHLVTSTQIINILIELPLEERVASRFLNRLFVLQKDDEESANDYVFEDVDRLVGEGSFNAVSGILNAINVQYYKTSVLLSLLSMSAFPAIRSRVKKSRKGFYDRVKNHLVATEHVAGDVEQLLYGLE